jgi:hypothetical protein
MVFFGLELYYFDACDWKLRPERAEDEMNAKLVQPSRDSRMIAGCKRITYEAEKVSLHV